MNRTFSPNFIRARAWLALAPFVLWAAYAAAPAKLDRPEPQAYLEHVKYLASDELQGRGAGTDGLRLAEEYIARQLKAAGLQPAGDSGSYLQAFTVTTGATMGDENSFEITQGGETEKLTPEQAYIPLNFSTSGSVSGGVVFAGYGATADEFNYDDYFHLPVEDKVVVVLRYEPPSFSKERSGRRERHYSHHAHLVSKAINARNRGAKAVILVNGDIEDSGELVKFGSVAGPDDASILMVQVTNAVAEKWFAAAGKPLSELQKSIDGNGRPQSFVFPDSFKISLGVEIERKQATVHNVIGYLPGETDEYIIIGAHHDHLGRGDQSSLAPSQIGEVHHGADDNASGTAGVIELARLFAQRGEKPHRGILFMTFGGEEIGLLGSAYWANHPTRPIENATAMINMDMIGRIRDSKVYIGGVGTGSTFRPLIEQAQKQNGLEVDYSKETHSSSDHTSFSSKGIPALFFFSGLHSDYHKPSDTSDKINAEPAAQLLAMVGDIAGELAAGERPAFSKVEAPKHGGGDGAGGGGYGPYFGSVPDFGQVESGVKFADVREGSPAGKAGLKAGDILTHFGAKPITNLYDFTYALRDSKVGDEVEVKVLRDGQEITAKVTLEARR
jgi:acetylornithine deacetylase/succinyl-diaminopimelate desuccinylase-like protein